MATKWKTSRSTTAHGTLGRLALAGVVAAFTIAGPAHVTPDLGLGYSAQAQSLKELRKRAKLREKRMAYRYVAIPRRFNLQAFERSLDEKKQERIKETPQEEFARDLRVRLKDRLGDPRRNRYAVHVGACAGEVLVAASRNLGSLVTNVAGNHGYKVGNDIPTVIQASNLCSAHSELCKMNKELVSESLSGGGKPVKVAILDTGTESPPLTNLLAELRPSLSNGRKVYQRRFIFKPGDPRPTIGYPENPADNNGHGTHMAGIVASMVRGEPSMVELMSLKTHDRDGAGSFYDNTQAIAYAARNGARVINASWGNYVGKGGETRSAVEAMRNCLVRYNEVLFVAAAGNYGNDNNKIPFYPASLNLRNVMSVMGSTWTYESSGLGTAPKTQCTAWGGTNYGTNRVRIAAPGTLVLSLYPKALVTSGQCYMSGSSVATAVITGDTVIRLAKNPGMENIAAAGAVLGRRSGITHKISNGVSYPAQNRSGSRTGTRGSNVAQTCTPRDTPLSPAVHHYAAQTCRTLRKW